MCDPGTPSVLSRLNFVSDSHSLSYPIRSHLLRMEIWVERVLASVRTEFQKIDIVQSPALGKMLFLDGHVQLATFDERAYHEALVHIPLLCVPHPRRALVVGGGDGGVLRELCRHPELEQIDMVEIDGQVVETCREHLPELSDGAFDDPRVHLFLEDAFQFRSKGRGPYDLIVMDITDVYEDEEGELSEQLFTDAFHQDCRAMLSERGVLVSQADNHVFCPYSQAEIQSTMSRFYSQVGSYHALVPSFGGFSAYVWCSMGTSVELHSIDRNRLDQLNLVTLNETSLASSFSELAFGGPGA